MTSHVFSDDKCPKCGSEMFLRPMRPYPVVLQSLFAISFIAFLLLVERIRYQPSMRWAIWGWCGAQFLLGIQLVRHRLQAKKTVLRCLRCR